MTIKRQIRIAEKKAAKLEGKSNLPIDKILRLNRLVRKISSLRQKL